MSQSPNQPTAAKPAPAPHADRAAITYYNPFEEREPDKAPLQAKLIRRIFGYTQPCAAKRNWLFLITVVRGLQLPALAWLIGRTINGPEVVHPGDEIEVGSSLITFELE